MRVERKQKAADALTNKKKGRKLRMRKRLKNFFRKINGMEKFIDENKSFSQIFDLFLS